MISILKTKQIFNQIVCFLLCIADSQDTIRILDPSSAHKCSFFRHDGLLLAHMLSSRDSSFCLLPQL